MTDIITPLTHLRDELLRTISMLEESLANPPKGHLRISHIKSGYNFYHYDSESEDKVTSSNGKYISRSNQEFIHALAQKDYDTAILNSSKKQLELVENFLTAYDPDELGRHYTELHPIRKKLLTLRVPPREVYVQRWMEHEYTPKPFAETDTTEYYTDNNERVRSKSEILLANRFKTRGIPYHYEYPLILPNAPVFHPDFTLLNKRTGKTYRWEHLGKMDDVSYVADNVERLNIYFRNGILPGKNLILTFETRQRPLSMKIIDNYIDEFLI